MFLTMSPRNTEAIERNDKARRNLYPRNTFSMHRATDLHPWSAYLLAGN